MIYLREKILCSIFLYTFAQSLTMSQFFCPNALPDIIWPIILFIIYEAEVCKVVGPVAEGEY